MELPAAAVLICLENMSRWIWLVRIMAVYGRSAVSLLRQNVPRNPTRWCGGPARLTKHLDGAGSSFTPVDLTALKCTQLIDVRIGLRLSMCRSVTGERVDQAAECSWSCGHRAANTRSLAALFKTGCRRSKPGGIARPNCRPDRGSSISAPRFQVLPAQDPRARPCFADHYGQCRYPRSAR